MATFLKNILSAKKAQTVIIVSAVTGRIIQLIYFYNIRLDMSYQVVATKNFVEGYGISLDTVTSADLSSTIYTPLINWPPGFSVIFSPFYILAGKNYIVAGLALSIIAATVLIFTSRGILKLFHLPVYLINLYTLVAGFFIYFFYFIASTDAIMFSFFFTSLYYTISLLKDTSRWQIKTAIITICLFVCASLKYLFVPAAFVIPVFLILKGYADKKKHWKKSGIYSLLFLALLVSILLGYQYHISNSVGYISASGRGFFPSHLLSAYPFVPSSVIRVESVALLVKNTFVEALLAKIFQILHVVFFIGCSVYIIRRVLKKGFKNLSPVASFFYIAFFISLSITVLLAALSMTVAKELWDSGYLWTYIEDQRYYGVANIFIHLGLFIAYWHINQSKKKTINYIFYFLFFLLFIEVARGIIFDINRLSNVKKEEYSWQSDNKLQQLADSILTSERIKNPGNTFIVAGTMNHVNTRICINSRVPIFKPVRDINDLTILHTKKPATLLVVLRDKDLPAYQPFLSVKDKKQMGYLYGYNFYIVYVNPY